MTNPTDPAPAPDRRELLSKATGLAMTGGLAASAGFSAWMAVKYLYPSRPRQERWLYVAPVRRIAPGESLPYRTPLGETVTIARQGEGEAPEDFVALSSTCPHLGCQVHWQGPRKRFFCPCHNGVFDPAGLATEGPPADEGLSLPRFPLRVEAGLLYIRVPVEGLDAPAS